jgi:hypothetical protein
MTAPPPPVGDPLDGLTIAVPCTVPWDSMSGDARRRFCSKCRLHVHDVSAMPRADAIAFLASKAPGARTCVRFFRRPDGRVLTDDCRAAVRALRRRTWLAAGLLLGACGLAGAAWARFRAADFEGGLSNPDLWDTQPFATVAKILPDTWLPVRAQVTMGEIAVPDGPETEEAR